LNGYELVSTVSAFDKRALNCGVDSVTAVLIALVRIPKARQCRYVSVFDILENRKQ
jgi:hypothetical protein